MLKPKVGSLAAIGGLFFLLLLVSCTEKKEITQVIQADLSAYVGSEACQSCHSTIYDSFKKTGHPFKLTPADSAQQAGYYPFTQLPGPPSSVTGWDDVSYVIGGFWWKTRFVGADGYIITAGGQNQYNFETEEWVDYHKDEQNKEYDCGECHTTGYSTEGHQDGLVGVVGTWAFPGVQCEACHGKGSLHVQSPKDYSMTIDRSSTMCGKCHVRDNAYKIDADGGWIKHHEQFEEILATKKYNMPCVDCHDPHVGLHASNPERANAIKTKCETCHFEEFASFANSEIPHSTVDTVQVDCIECHMPYAAKSAVGDAATHKADIRSHLFRINTDPKAEMFSSDGKSANGYLTVEYTCIHCHWSKDKAWALSYADRVHAKPAGPTTCFNCHGDDNTAVLLAGRQWENSLHSTGENIDRNSSSCAYCHTNEGFVSLIETGTKISPETPTGIGCFTCHAPHTTGSLGLRTDESYSLENGVSVDIGKGNLCVNCHHSRRNVNTYVYDGVKMSSHYGPHYSNQADMLAGTGGYEYSGVTYSNSPHTIQVETEDGCVACHMEVADRYVMGGHSMNLEWEEEEHTDACDQPGCHGDIGTFNYKGAQTTVDSLLTELKDKLLAGNLIDEEGHPISRVVATADSAGALYNYKFVEEDKSKGIHNTDYAIQLLESSLDFLGTKGGGKISSRWSTSLSQADSPRKRP